MRVSLGCGGTIHESLASLRVFCLFVAPPTLVVVGVGVHGPPTLPLSLFLWSPLQSNAHKKYIGRARKKKSRKKRTRFGKSVYTGAKHGKFKSIIYEQFGTKEMFPDCSWDWQPEAFEGLCPRMVLTKPCDNVQASFEALTSRPEYAGWTPFHNEKVLEELDKPGPPNQWTYADISINFDGVPCSHFKGGGQTLTVTSYSFGDLDPDLVGSDEMLQLLSVVKDSDDGLSCRKDKEHLLKDCLFKMTVLKRYVSKKTGRVLVVKPMWHTS